MSKRQIDEAFGPAMSEPHNRRRLEQAVAVPCQSWSGTPSYYEAQSMPPMTAPATSATCFSSPSLPTSLASGHSLQTQQPYFASAWTPGAVPQHHVQALVQSAQPSCGNQQHFDQQLHPLQPQPTMTSAAISNDVDMSACGGGVTDPMTTDGTDSAQHKGMQRTYSGTELRIMLDPHHQAAMFPNPSALLNPPPTSLTGALVPYQNAQVVVRLSVLKQLHEQAVQHQAARAAAKASGSRRSTPHCIIEELQDPDEATTAAVSADVHPEVMEE